MLQVLEESPSPPTPDAERATQSTSTLTDNIVPRNPPVFDNFKASQMFDPDISIPSIEITSTITSEETTTPMNEMERAGLITKISGENVCDVCKKSFSRNRDLRRHTKSVHEKNQVACHICEKNFARKDNLIRHMKTHAKATSMRSTEPKEAPPAKIPKRRQYQLQQTEQAFDGVMRTFRIDNLEGFRDISSFLKNVEPPVIDELTSSEHEFKVNFRLFCLFEKKSEEKKIEEIKCFKTKNEVVLPSTNISHIYHEASEKLQTEATEFEGKDSGWTLVEIKYLEFRTNKYNPLRTSSYIPLPKVIQDKHAAINVKNEDYQ